MAENEGQLVLCEEEGLPPINVRYDQDSAWLSQAEIAELFDRDVRTINEHIKNIFDEGELLPEATIRNFRIVQNEGSRGVTRSIVNYNLDVIISVGYRVNSKIGTKFRQWATKRLNQYITNGFVIDEHKFRDPSEEQLDSLVARVRKIRTSEKLFYLKVRDIFATSTDYDKNGQECRWFFAMVQNQFHYAITGLTAAELVMARIDINDPHLGLSSWSGNNITLPEATNAKNYLTADELKRLELLVEQFLSFAELRSMEGTPMTMQDWLNKVNAFFTLNDKPILTSLGETSHDDMKKYVFKALNEFNRLRGLPIHKPLKRGAATQGYIQ